MKLSVVIPVYRTEATLNRCVESVLCQEIDDIEVILVDDGSPDSCPQLCDEWQQRDPRVHVIHKANGGLSDARNAGIDVATGDYITFVDSDDFLAAGTYRALQSKTQECDILEYSVFGRLLLPERTYTSMTDYWLQGQAYSHAYAWNKIYRRSLFDTVRFPKGKIFEDIYTLPLLLRNAHMVCTTSNGYYYYSENPTGITATAGGEGLTMLLDAHLSSGMPVDDRYYMFLVNIQMDVENLTHAPIRLPSRHVSTSGLPFKQKLKASVLNIFGINNICKINKFVHLFLKPSRW